MANVEVQTSVETAGTILVVDDNPQNLSLLCNMLETAGYRVRPAISGELALRAAKLAPPDVVLLDIRMPNMDGFEVCRRLRADETTHEVPIIFISALQSTEDKVRAFREGGTDYVTKPFQMDEVLARINTQVALSKTRRELHLAYEEMEARVQQRTLEAIAAREEQHKATVRLNDSLGQTIGAIALALEMRDPYTAGHQQRVATIAVAIAEKLGLDRQRIEGIRLGASIHDIGKIQIPAEILNRPGVLSPIEFTFVKSHPQAGQEIMERIDFPWPIAEMVRQHHERLDGSGYPRGLKGDQILLEARIISVADVVEAISSHRPYRPSLGLDAAIREVERDSGTKYDPSVVKALVELEKAGLCPTVH